MTAGSVECPVAGVPLLDIDPFDEAFLRDPYPYHERMREAGPLVWLAPLGVFAMARHEEVSSALKDWETFVSSRGVGLLDFAREEPWRPPSLLLEVDPPLHDRTRAIVDAVVTLHQLKQLELRWRQVADELVDNLLARGRIDAVTDLAEVFPLLVFPEAMGLREPHTQHLLTYAAHAFNAFGPRNEIFRQSEARAGAAIAWVNEACARPRLLEHGWGADIYAAADRGACTPEEAARLVRSFLTAGVDTTVTGIANLMHAFARHPDQWAAFLSDPKSARRAFDESLRWESAVQTFFRTTSRPAQIGPHTCPEGAKVLLFLGAANRDPRRWVDPERFDITRATGGHVGFGYGIHRCLGQMVARLEAEVLLAALAARVKTIRLTGAPQWRLNNTLRALDSLPVELAA